MLAYLKDKAVFVTVRQSNPMKKPKQTMCYYVSQYFLTYPACLRHPAESIPPHWL